MLGLKYWRRRRIGNRPFPSEWQIILEKNVPLYGCLPFESQSRLRALIQVFLAEKPFEGCGGLEITDEIRVTIAAQGCILLLGLDRDDLYPKLRSILVYPGAYIARVSDQQPDGTVVEGPENRSGESWNHGYVVLSWNDVLQGTSDTTDGRNIVYHEFAHQLDNESGSTEGAPLLPNREMLADWTRVLRAEYEALCAGVERREDTFLDPYGAESPAEFFAVATEFFFELPVELQQRHPDLYGQLRLYYRQDPAIIQKGC